jgi:hypothetical protein
LSATSFNIWRNKFKLLREDGNRRESKSAHIKVLPHLES